MEITPTLNFGGQCREALHAYAEAFGGEITCLITYRDGNGSTFVKDFFTLFISIDKGKKQAATTGEDR